jgi:hypothetical protein
MTLYIPETGTKIIPEVVKHKETIGLLNAPAIGIRIRATLGQTVLVGRIHKHSPYGMFYIALDQPKTADSSHKHTLEFAVWVGAGWTFEIIDGVTA